MVATFLIKRKRTGLIAHPCPATVYHPHLEQRKRTGFFLLLAQCRSSGPRVSTAAKHSAGGFAMSILSKDQQYMVREPIAPGAYNSLMHSIVKLEELMEIANKG